jgi:hypothetical protein
VDACVAEEVIVQQWEYLVVITFEQHWSDSEGRKGTLQKNPAMAAFSLRNYNEGPLLASLGSEGWELVAATQAERASLHELYFKRPKP